MLKKRYIIIGLAIASALLGSLFYSNIIQAQKGKEPTSCKDSVEISVLDWTARKIPRDQAIAEHGVRFFSGGYPITFTFTFAPKQTFLNVTEMWINIIAIPPDQYTDAIRFNITMNNQATISTDEMWMMWSEHPYLEHPHQLSVCVKDSSIYKNTEEGINSLTFSEPQRRHSSYGTWAYTALEIFKVTMFIEYEYQAR